MLLSIAGYTDRSQMMHGLPPLTPWIKRSADCANTTLHDLQRIAHSIHLVVTNVPCARVYKPPSLDTPLTALYPALYPFKQSRVASGRHLQQLWSFTFDDCCADSAL